MKDTIDEDEAKKLLSRMASCIGFEFVEMPRSTRYERHWCFSIGFARFTNNYFSLSVMLEMVLKAEVFMLCPGTWDMRAGEKTCYPNPFYRLSLDELKVKLDLLGAEEEV